MCFTTKLNFLSLQVLEKQHQVIVFCLLVFLYIPTN